MSRHLVSFQEQLVNISAVSILAPFIHKATPGRMRRVLSMVVLMLIVCLTQTVSAQVWTLSTGATFTLTSGAVFAVNGGVAIGTGATWQQIGSGTIYVQGNWTNNGIFIAGTGSVLFGSSATQTIGGLLPTTFYSLVLSKPLPTAQLLIDQSITTATLTLNQGVFRIRNTSSRTIDIQNGDLVIPVNSVVDVESGGSALHSIRLNGGIRNSNTLQLNPGGSAADVVLSSAGNVVIDGTGSVTTFRNITLSKPSQSDTVQLMPSVLTVPATGFLTLQGGTMRLSGAYTLSNPVFTTANYSIPTAAGLWIDNPSVTITGQNGDAALGGLLRISTGTMRVGTSANQNNLLYSSGARLLISGGSLDVVGRISRGGDNNATITYSQSAGTVTVGMGVVSSAVDRGVFDIAATGSSFTWSGGSIEVRRQTANAASGGPEYWVGASTYSVTTGTILRINAAVAGQTIGISSTAPIGELLMTGTNSPVATLANNTLTVLGNITIAGTGTGRLDANGQNISLRGNWINNGTTDNAFTPSAALVTLNGAGTQLITGAFGSRFYNLSVNKNGSDTVRLFRSSRVDGNLRLLTNSVVDIDTSNLTIGTAGNIYTDNASAVSFGASRTIYSSRGTASGFLYREIPAGAATPYNVIFPMGTPGVYTPADISFLLNKATFSSGAYVGVKPVPQEHPAVERTGISMRKYWIVTSANIAIQPAGVNALFYYNTSEPQGNEGSYVVLYFAPSYPSPQGFWRIDPGQSDDVVDFNSKLFYSQQVDQLNGDWTAGEIDAGAATYFSRADGDYNTPSTWSKVNFNGPVSTTAPNKQSDKVRIQGHTVVVSSTIASVNSLSVEQNGTLRMTGSFIATGDTMRVQANAVLAIGHPDGIAPIGSTGAVQTIVRDLSPNAIYVYEGVGTQRTGNGLPSPVRTVVINKAATDTLRLNSYISIADSLVLNNGILDVSSYSIDGSSAGRILTMRGGEMVLRSAFPNNYQAPTFTAGTITFNGSGNTTIPSSSSVPSVAQYYNLRLGGQRNGFFTLAAGDIQIANAFDLSTLQFTGTVSQRFFTDGSTVIFNGASAQNIPCRPLSPPDSIASLPYYNLVLAGSGTKQLSATTATTFVVLNNLSIQTGATLSANGFDIEVQHDWINSGGVFAPGSRTVFFRSTVPLATTRVTSRDVVDNPFNHVVVTGQGRVTANDNMLVQGNLTIATSATLALGATTLTLYGNWMNLGSFTSATSTVVFNGFTTQYITKATASNEEFYNLTVQNTAGVNASSAGNSSNYGVIVNNTLHLLSGSIVTRNRYATVYGSVVRTGSSTPGHVDGPLRKTVATNTNTVTYEVGYGRSYTPVIVDVNGTGGIAGLLSIESDTVTASSTPISTGLNPTGSGMNDSRHLRRQWKLTVPAGSAFALGPDRSYDATFTFLPGAAPAGDLRGSADPMFLETRMWNGSAWVAPDRFSFPKIGNRTATTTQMRLNKAVGTFTAGEPTQYSFYSIADGTWDTPASWSTQDYGGTATTIAPTATAFVYIGDNKTITLAAGATTTSPGAVTVDSTGKFLTDAFVLSGTGSFSLSPKGALGIGSAAGITTSGATGSIQTSTRQYNPSSHNRGHFIYTNSASQASGNGLPATVQTLTVQKASGAILTLGANIAVSDSLHIQSGTLDASSRTLTLSGNMLVSTGAVFTPQTSTVVFSGSTTQTLTAGSTVVFNNLTISKSTIAGHLVLSTNTNIQISSTLTFAAGNAGTINARTSTNAYVTALSTITRTGLGHIDGELRKPIGSDASTVVFEVGEGRNYTPYTLALSGSGGTAGQLAVQVIPGKQPYLDDFYVSPIDPERYIPRYWRLTQPSGSAFARGSRSLTVTLQFLDPNDLGTVDAAGCLDVAYWKGLTNRWQPLRPNSTDPNFTAGYRCGDSRLTLGAIDYDGSANSVIVNALPADTTLGSNEILADGSLLLGEFVAGNQNSIAITTYYTRQSGNWTDPNTWSTVAYGGPAASGYPRTQYDIVLIGNNNRVRLNENIGTSRLYSDFDRNQFYGPVVTVEATGALSFGAQILRGNAFTAKNGCTLEIGSADGLSAQGTWTGNVFTDTRAIEDSINVIYTAEGYTLTSGPTYCRPRMTADNTYISRVRVRDASSNTIMDNNTGSTLKGYPAAFYFPDISATVTAGQQYTIITGHQGTGTRLWTVWIDYNRNGVFDDTYERIANSSFSSSSDRSITFTVPAGGDSVMPGITHMRVRIKEGSSSETSCANDHNGEIEDYTVRIVKDSRQVVQQTGNGLPNNLRSLQVNSTRATVSAIQLGRNITVRDSVKITRGYFYPVSYTIGLSGDFINDYTNGFTAATSTIQFLNGGDQQVRGTVSSIFNNISVNKSGAGKVLFTTSATIRATTTFSSDNLIALSSGITLTFGTSATITSASFSNKRMIQVDGGSNTGLVLKQFSTAAGTKSFVFPVGIDTVYNPADISLIGTYASTPSFGVQLYGSKHPQRLSEKVLKKYWTVTTNNISAITANTLRFTYAAVDTSGNGQKYIPAQYNAGTWEINVGTSPTAVPSPIVISSTQTVTGSWTAGESDGFFRGRIFYSRATGNWNIPASWSNIGHASSVPSSYYPGQLYAYDTVIVDGHTITFNVDSVAIDSLQVGGSHNGTAAAGRGILSFGASPLVKALTVRSHLNALSDGRIEGSATAGRRDTLRLYGRLTNAGTTTATAGILLWNSANAFTTLQFENAGNSTISGDGYWGTVATVRVLKTGLADTLINQSSSFAGATGLAAQYALDLQKGVLRQNASGSSLSLSYGSVVVQMQTFTGLDIWAGTIRSSSNVITNVSTTIRLNGGNLTVGDAVNEHLFYKTGTAVNLVSGTLDIAGCLTRDQAPSLIDFTLSSAATVRVLSKGNTDVAKIGFDISNSASTFSMSGGRIIIASGTTGAVADYNVSATGGSGMTGGVLQTGDTTLTTPGTILKVVGATPIYNWRAVGANVISQVAGQVVNVSNNIVIDDNHTFQLRGNTLQLGGNLTNYGTFDPVTGSTAVEPRLLVANGNGNTQVFYNDDAGGLTLYNFRLEKSNGKVQLATAGNSNLTINNTLEFALDNTAVLDARTGQRSVTVTPSGASSPQVLRNGLGHVDGRLYRYIGTGVQSVSFAVGTSATVGYTPAIFETSGSGGTAGLVGVIAYGNDHPRLAEAPVRTNSNVQRYWNVTTASSFALGAGRTYLFTTQFLNPEDLRGGANILFFEHNLYSPACPDAPAVCPPGTGSWRALPTPTRSDTTITSQGNTIYGDFVIAEPAGYTFYSIASGNWDNVNTWSMDSYTGAVAPRIPDQATDIVHVGNGRRVTVPETITPQVRAVYVERYNGLPGELYINGNLGYIRGLSFVLEDSCTLGMQHLNGIAPNGTVGAVQMDSRNFGVGRFVYNSIYGGQNSGRALPDSIAALIVDNPSPTVNTLYITNYAGAPTVRVRDSILVEQGTFSSGGRDIVLYGDMVMRGNSVYTPLSANFVIAGSAQHYIALNNTDGVRFYNLELAGSDVLVTSSVSSATAQVYIDAQLLFSTAAAINVRDYSRRVVMATGATVSRPVNAGFVDGTMRKPFGAGAGSLHFEIGNDTAYTPVTLTITSTSGTGTAGAVDAINLTPVPPEPFVGNRMDTAVFVPRFWRVTAADGFVLGPRKVNTLLGFPASEASLLTLANTVIRSRTIPALTPPWRDRRFLIWNATAATVQLDPADRLWESFGDFFVGQKAQRIFYSRQDGPWDDPNSWSFYGHDGPPVPVGEYPNPDWGLSSEFEFETRDSVVIGGNDRIVLNTLPEVAYVEIASTGTLVVNDSRYVSASSLGLSSFVIRDGGTLNNQTSYGIETGLNGLLRFADASRTFDPGANYEFSGALDQYFGGAFPTAVHNITINNDNNSRNVYINQSGVVVNGALDIARGILQFDNNNAAGAPADQLLTLNGDLSIATGATLSIESAGTGPRSHTLVINGDVENNGSWIMCPTPGNASIKGETVFSSTATQTITGSGGTTRLYGVTLDKGSAGSTVVSSVDIEISRSDAPAMTFSNGTWEQTAGTLSLDGCASATTQTITANGAIHLTGTGSLEQNATMVLNGGELLLNTTGRAQIGDAVGENLVYENSSTSRLTVVDGALEVAGRISRGATPGGDLVYNQSGGTVVVGTIGHNSNSAGTFDITSGSSFTMSNGSIVVRSANASTDPNRPADFTLLANTTSITGGSTQFSDNLTPPGTLLDYNIAPSVALWNLVVSSATTTVVPRDPSATLRLQGDIVNNGAFDASVTRSGAPATTSTVVFQGSGMENQSVLGTGTTTMQNLTMNRGAGTGVVELIHTVTVDGVIDFREGSNANNQVIELASTTANLILTNCSTTAIVDAGGSSAPYHYVRTDNTGGQLVRTICPSGVYLFPIGSFDAGQDNYTPSSFVANPTGTSGTVGVSVSRGNGTNGGHAQILPTASDYLERYWSIGNVTTTIGGQWQFDYLDGAAHITGDESDFTKVGRWRPAYEAPGGSWSSWNSTINTSANFFTSNGAIPASEFTGDWTVGGADVFRRVFYSLMTGQWSNPASWTFSPSHSGAMAGPGVWPSEPQDSVVIGGGANGVGNHVISLDNNIAVQGLALGTSSSNTGTLYTNAFVLSGQNFTMGDNSTLGIGSPNGIAMAPVTTGNIQTTYRMFSTSANYVYNGSVPQSIGSALPPLVRSMTVDNSGTPGNNTVLLDRPIDVTENLSVLRGVYDMQVFTMNNLTGQGILTLAANAVLRLGGTSSLNSAAANYDAYSLDAGSTVEFYGANQTIPPAPNAGVGYGHVVVSEPGAKRVVSPVRIRGNLSVRSNSLLDNQAGVNSLEVLGNIYNDGTLTNGGTIEVGN